MIIQTAYRDAASETLSAYRSGALTKASSIEDVRAAAGDAIDPSLADHEVDDLFIWAVRATTFPNAILVAVDETYGETRGSVVGSTAQRHADHALDLPALAEAMGVEALGWVNKYTGEAPAGATVYSVYSLPRGDWTPGEVERFGRPVGLYSATQPVRVPGRAA